jgi:phospholipid/cholesterol/gamma-HCH transport system substrate-binding protein
MTPRRRNVLVGLVVLVGLGSVVWMVLLFAGRLANIFSTPGLHITITADRADGVSDGSTIYYLGTEVGRVERIYRGSDNRSVVIIADVNKEPPLPGNVHAVIKTSSALGSASQISLEFNDGKPSQNPLQDQAAISGSYVGSGLIPPEFQQLAEDMKKQNLIPHLDETVVSIKEQSEKAGQLLGSMQQLIGDEKTRDEIHTAVTNIHAASESAARVGANLEKFSANLETITVKTDQTMSDVRVAAGKIGTVLDHIDSVTAKVDQGKGTAGMLVNDPKLYQGLVDTTKELNATVADLQRVIQQWEQEGVTIKLGK